MFTVSAIVGTVAVVVVVALVRELPPTDVTDRDVATGPSASANTLLDVSDLTGSRTFGPTIPRANAERAWLGIEGRDADGAVLVTAVVASGPAALAGVRAGDLIVAAEREAVATMAQLQALVAALEPGVVFVLDVLPRPGPAAADGRARRPGLSEVTPGPEVGASAQPDRRRPRRSALRPRSTPPTPIARAAPAAPPRASSCRRRGLMVAHALAGDTAT